MLLLISAITSNAFGDDAFHEEWRRVNRELNMDGLMKGLDQNGNVIDLRNQAHQKIDPESLGSSEAETGNVELSVQNKRPQEIRVQGREAMYQNQKTANLLSDLQKNVDRSQPGVNAIFKKAERIADKQASIADNLSQYLKEKYGIDIGCRSTSGQQSAIDTPFIMAEETIEIHNEIYEPKYCEQLLNTYDCTTDANIKCVEHSSKIVDLNIVNSNTEYTKNNNLIHIDHRYEGKVHRSRSSTSNYGSSNRDYQGPSSTTYRTHYYLAKAELRIIFDIPFNLDTLDELALLNLNFSHIIWIRLNGRSLYPQDWSELTFKHPQTLDIGNQTHHYESRPAIETGRGIMVIGRQTGPVNHIGGIDLKPFVKAGHNELVIHGASTEKSHIILDIRAQEKACLKWSEKWVETCVLRAS